MNNFVFTGNLTRDPEFREVKGQNGITRVGTVSIAINNGKNSQADFFSINCWGKLSNALDYLKKGDKILIEGSIKNNKYEKNGVEVHTFNFNASSIEFLVTKNKSQEHNDYEQQQNSAPIMQQGTQYQNGQQQAPQNYNQQGQYQNAPQYQNQGQSQGQYQNAQGQTNQGGGNNQNQGNGNNQQYGQQPPQNQGNVQQPPQNNGRQQHNQSQQNQGPQNQGQQPPQNNGASKLDYGFIDYEVPGFGNISPAQDLNMPF